MAILLIFRNSLINMKSDTNSCDNFLKLNSLFANYFSESLAQIMVCYHILFYATIPNW